jgi:hypothetical protein
MLEFNKYEFKLYHLCILHIYDGGDGLFESFLKCPLPTSALHIYNDGPFAKLKMLKVKSTDNIYVANPLAWSKILV